jgi:hypothetical protein
MRRRKRLLQARKESTAARSAACTPGLFHCFSVADAVNRYNKEPRVVAVDTERAPLRAVGTFKSNK